MLLIKGYSFLFIHPSGDERVGIGARSGAQKKAAVYILFDFFNFALLLSYTLAIT